MAPIATVCNNNKMKKIATEPAEPAMDVEEPNIPTVSSSPPPPAVEAPLSEYIFIIITNSKERHNANDINCSKQQLTTFINVVSVATRFNCFRSSSIYHA